LIRVSVGSVVVVCGRVVVVLVLVLVVDVVDDVVVESGTELPVIVVTTTGGVVVGAEAASPLHPATATATIPQATDRLICCTHSERFRTFIRWPMHLAESRPSSPTKMHGEDRKPEPSGSVVVRGHGGSE
jgi:hypothetical protein